MSHADDGSSLVDELGAIVGLDHVLVDAELVKRYATDWTGRWVGSPIAVVRPGDTDQVSQVLRWCSRSSIPFVPLGGNTGLVGGTFAREDSLLVSLERLKTLGDVSIASGQCTFGAGVVLIDAQAHAHASGYDVAVDLGARGSATIGGMTATNAGGIHVVRHGMMRRTVVGIEAVLADGSIVRHLPEVEKDNTGYDLASLFTGSEGTLGIITAVRLRLVPHIRSRVAVLAGLSSWDEAVSLVASLRALASLHAAEVMAGSGVRRVGEVFGWAVPPVASAAVVVLIELASAHDNASEHDVDDLAVLLATHGAESIVGTDTARVGELWRWREEHTAAIARLGVPCKLDVSVPIERVPAFCGDVRARVAAAGFGELFLFGHLADGNIHVNVVPFAGKAPYDDATFHAIETAVLDVVLRHRGSISAEHGIGRAKRAWLAHARSAESIDTFTLIKRALDPQWLANPGCLLPNR